MRALWTASSARWLSRRIRVAIAYIRSPVWLTSQPNASRSPRIACSTMSRTRSLRRSRTRPGPVAPYEWTTGVKRSVPCDDRHRRWGVEFIDVVMKRRAVRRFEGGGVDRDVIERIAGLAQRTPSAGFSQGQRLVVVTDPGRRRELARICHEDDYQ